MTNSIQEYEKVHDLAIDRINAVLETIKLRINDWAEDEIDLNDRNYDLIIKTLESQLADTEKARVRYKYDKMDRTEFDLILKNIAEGKPTKIVTVGKKHRLRSVDTLRLLSITYKVTIDKILEHNNITVENFDDLKERNTVIDIPIIVDLGERTKYSDLPVFGSVNGQNAWGTDVSNALEVNTDGDLKVLENEQTLVQGIQNRFGFYGSIPMYEKDSIDLAWGKDYSPELVDLLTIVRLEAVIPMDRRIRKVKDVQISDQENGKLIKLYLEAINGSETIKAKLERAEKEFVSDE